MTHSIDTLAGTELLQAVAEAEGVELSQLDPWAVFTRVVELVVRTHDPRGFRASLRIPGQAQLFPPGWHDAYGEDTLTATLRVHLKRLSAAK